MYSNGPPHMARQKQDDHLEHTYSSYVRIRDVALKTSQRQWTIGRSGEKGSEISVPAARHDDDDDIYKQIVRRKHFRTTQSAFVCTQLHGFKYSYQTLIVQFTRKAANWTLRVRDMDSKLVWVCLIYGISTVVGYLMSNSLYM